MFDNKFDYESFDPLVYEKKKSKANKQLPYFKTDPVNLNFDSNIVKFYSEKDTGIVKFDSDDNEEEEKEANEAGILIKMKAK